MRIRRRGGCSGVIDAHLSLDAVDAQLAEHRDQAYRRSRSWRRCWSACVSLVFVWSGGLPAGERAARRAPSGWRSGDLAYRLPVRSDDELGDLAGSFNEMTAEVDERTAR